MLVQASAQERITALRYGLSVAFLPPFVTGNADTVSLFDLDVFLEIVVKCPELDTVPNLVVLSREGEVTVLRRATARANTK